MATLRQRIETAFERFGHWVFRNRWLTLLLMLVFAAAFISQLPKIRVDTSNEGFLHPNDPTLIQYNKFRHQFGNEEMIALTIDTPDLFNEATLIKLKDLHNELKDKVPYFNDINSLINARNTRGEGDRLIVEDLFEHWPANAAELEAIKQRALASNTYKNFILSEDGKLTTIMIELQAFSAPKQTEADVMAGFEDETKATTQVKPDEHATFLTDKETGEAVAVMKEIVNKYQAPDFKIIAAGAPVVVAKLKASMQHDMQTFTRFALLAIVVILFFLFRRLSGVLLPVVVVVLTLLSTIGLMAATGTPLKLPTQLLPSLMLAVSVAAAVHLIAIFYGEYHESANKEKSIAYALGHSGFAIVMTSATTAAGLLSFSTSGVAPIADLGLFAGAGVLLSLVYTLVLIPALIAIFPIKHKGGKTETVRHPIIDGFLLWAAHFSVRHAKPIVVVSLVLMVVSLISLLNIRFYHNPLAWMPEEWDVRQATKTMDERMKGSITLEAVINTNKENGLYDPALLNSVLELQTGLEGKTFDNGYYIGKAASITDIVRESNRALHGNDQSHYTIPQDRDLIAQELLLFENAGSDDLENFVDSQFSQARVTLKGPWADAGTSTEVIEQTQAQLSKTFGSDVETYITGMGTLFSRTMEAAIESTRVSYVIAAVVITIMMIFLLGEVKLGLVSMIPNFLPIMIALGVMAAVNVPLDQFTMLVGSIALGLAVDDTIHILHNFKRYHHKTGDVEEAIRRTLMSTGRAILVTTLVLCMGFYIFMAASMYNVIRFGMITGSTILLALFADLFLSPALMQLMYGKKKTVA